VCCHLSVPGKVLNVHVTHVDSHTLSLAWDFRDDVTVYEVRHWELRDVTGASVNVTSSSNFTLLRLAHDTQYSFQVLAASPRSVSLQCILTDVLSILTIVESDNTATFYSVYSDCFMSFKSACYSWNSMLPTPTPIRTLGMRLSWNFVNVYTIAYHVQYSTRTRVHARIPYGHPREEKRASDKSPRTSLRVERAARAAAGRLPRCGARRLLRAPDTPTSARGSSRGSRRGSPCRCRCPCRSCGI